MKILHMTAPGPVGGLESVVHSLARGQRAQGHDASVLASTTPDDAGRGEATHPFIASLRASDIPVHHIVCPAVRVDLEWRATRDVVDALKPDVLHTHGVRSDLIGGSVALSRDVPVVSTQHGDVTPTARSRAILGFQRRLLRRFAAVVAVSRPLHDRLAASGVPAHRLHTVRNAWTGGVDFLTSAEARSVLELPAEGPVLGWVGRISREKGPDVLVDALALLDEEGARVVASIVGDGPMRPALTERTAAFESVDVRWHAAIPGAASLFAAFDALVLSSRSEGTPVVLLEAMAAGVPIVATAVGGVPDVTGDDAAELVAGEDPAALAAAIRTVLSRPGLTRRRVEVARSRLRTEFGAASWLRRHDQLYEAVAAAPNRSTTTSPES